MDQCFQALVQEGWLREAVEKALDVGLPGAEARQVSLVLTCDEMVRSLNRDYRGLDEVTDVLSFSSFHSGSWEGETEPPEKEYLDALYPGGPSFVYPPGEAVPLGEVIIAYPQAKRQASLRGVPLDQELALLIVHGVLHLAGHDHLELLEQQEMREKEEAALEAIQQCATTQDGMLDE